KALNRLLTRETVDLIVLDLMLPGEDGLSICRRLRAANDVTPIIMLTAKVEDVDRIVGLEVGADDYLPKPFNPRELLARIHAVLRRRPAQEAPGAPAKDPEEPSSRPAAPLVDAPTPASQDLPDDWDMRLRPMPAAPRPKGQPAGQLDADDFR
ncbi:MAG: hypothetical protein RL385_2227, partial [Pseudomonadota bacterium]